VSNDTLIKYVQVLLFKFKALLYQGDNWVFLMIY